jgi:aminomethyltransferase
MPLHYGSILSEARAVRESAGMFDVSHMGRLRVRGPDTLELLQYVGTNDLTKIGPGKAQYTLLCTPDGGTIDDLIVSWTNPSEFLVVVNASRRDDDLAHLTDYVSGRDVSIVDETASTAMIALQGPRSRELVAQAGELRRFGVMRTDVAGVGALVTRTGYTGEDGVEIICEAGAAPRVWAALLESGAVPCGLGSRDALRMEMGYPLYGHELGLDISPLEAGLSFAVAFAKPGFIGRDALEKVAREGPARTLKGFVCARPCVPAQGDEVGDGGVVTSGGTSVVLNKPIGLAFVNRTGDALLHNRGKEIPVDIRELPLIDRSRPKT